MFERFLEYIEYLTSDTWFKYVEKAEELYKTGYQDYIPKLRQVFLLDVFETFVIALFISFICASIGTSIYQKRHNIKMPKELMFKILFHSFSIAFFKTEFILLSPIILFILCFNYLRLQEIKTAVLKTGKSIIFLYALLFICLIFYVMGSLKNI